MTILSYRSYPDRMGLRRLSPKTNQSFFIFLVACAALLDVCHAGLGANKNKRDVTNSPASAITSNETAQSVTTSELQNGQVITSFLTTYVLVTFSKSLGDVTPSIAFQDVPASSVLTLNLSSQAVPGANTSTSPTFTSATTLQSSFRGPFANTSTTPNPPGLSSTSTSPIPGSNDTLPQSSHPGKPNVLSSTIGGTDQNYSSTGTGPTFPTQRSQRLNSTFNPSQTHRSLSVGEPERTNTSHSDATRHSESPSVVLPPPSVTSLTPAITTGSSTTRPVYTSRTHDIVQSSGNVAESSTTSLGDDTPRGGLSSTIGTSPKSTIEDETHTTSTEDASSSHTTKRNAPDSSTAGKDADESSTTRRENASSSTEWNSDGTSTAQEDDRSKSTSKQKDSNSSTDRKNDDESSTTANEDNQSSTSPSSGSSRVSSTSSPARSTTAQPGGSATSGVSSATSTSSDNSYTVLFMTATTTQPPGVDSTTKVTWTSSEVTTSSSDGGIIFPWIVPVWGCIGPICHPQCLIPFLGCNMPQLKLPGPMGFPWATPPPIPPKEPRKGDPNDPEDPRPSETPTTTSSESSCTASTTLYPNCGQSCVARPVTTIDKSTSFSTSCFTATCQPTVVCSKTVETTTTTTISTDSATPSEFFCSPESNCGYCVLSSTETQSGLSKRVINYVDWNPPDDDELLNHPDGIWVKDVKKDAAGNDIPINDRPYVTTWPAGEAAWRLRMFRQIKNYCDGAEEQYHRYSDGENSRLGPYGVSTMRVSEWADRGIVGGSGPLWGCSILMIITKRGIYVSHNWEVPNFANPYNYPGLDLNEEFHKGVEIFLKEGDAKHRGIDQLKEQTHIFDNMQEDTLQIIIFTPQTGFVSPMREDPVRDALVRHPAAVERWKNFIVGLGFPRDKIMVQAYVKGPLYWPGVPRPLQEGQRAMDYWQPESSAGLAFFQYHPAHKVDGVNRGPTIKVFWEYYDKIIFESSWCYREDGTVAARDDGGGSCPVPQAAGNGPSASGDGGSASASASKGRSNSSGKTSTSITFTSSQSAKGPGSISSGNTAVATSKSSATKTPGPSSTAPSSSPPSSSTDEPLKRTVHISQEIRGNIHKKDDVHMANITISETKDGNTTVLESEQHSDGGKFRSLPSAQTLTDGQGNELRIEFKKTEHHNITLWANSNGKPEFWSIENLEKDEKNPMKPWCEVNSTVPNRSAVLILREIECFYFV
ncbi:hypothetical protein CGCSCA5_v002003 [Colletotrichum siamense]|nr:hypothetical protein CGCSCA5_v002003 [Colletotrichum siamense]